MSLARSAYYQSSAAAAARRAADAALLGEIEGIAGDFPAYGYRRITHELRRRGTVVNHKRVARLMREGQVAPARVRRFVTTTHSAEDIAVFPNLVPACVVTGPNQIWYADLTYIRLRTRFVFLAVLLDAWSRKVVGYAISPHLDARLPLAALDAALTDRAPVARIDSPLRPRRAAHVAAVPRAASGARGPGFDVAPGQPVRQRDHRKLHENAQVRGDLSTCLRHRGRRHRQPPTLYRGALQSTTAPLIAWVPSPRRVREAPFSTRRLGQISEPQLSASGGSLQISCTMSPPPTPGSDRASWGTNRHAGVDGRGDRGQSVAVILASVCMRHLIEPSPPSL